MQEQSSDFQPLRASPFKTTRKKKMKKPCTTMNNARKNWTINETFGSSVTNEKMANSNIRPNRIMMPENKANILIVSVAVSEACLLSLVTLWRIRETIMRKYRTSVKSSMKMIGRRKATINGTMSRMKQLQKSQNNGSVMRNTFTYNPIWWLLP